MRKSGRPSQAARPRYVDLTELVLEVNKCFAVGAAMGVMRSELRGTFATHERALAIACRPPLSEAAGVP